MAGNVVVLSTGSNHSWLPKEQLQAQIEKTIQTIKAQQPNAQIVMVNPVKNFTWGFPSGQSSTIPYDAVTGAASKYGIQTVDFDPGEDNIHPADTGALVDKIQSLTGTPASQWTPIGDSIAKMVANQTGASADLTKNSMTPQYILENFASKLAPDANVTNAPVTAQKPGPATAQDIQQIYADIFGRTAEQGGLDYWKGLADTQGLDAMTLRDQIGRAGLGSDAQAAAQKLVDSGQSQYLGGGMEWNPTQPAMAAQTSAAIDPNLQQVRNDLQAGTTLQNLGQTPATTTPMVSPLETITPTTTQPTQPRQPAQPIGANDITQIYKDLFGRTAEQGGLDYWQNMAQTQGLGLSDLTSAMAQAGKDPNAQAAAQQLVDTGQSQYIGGGTVWNPTTPNYYAYGGRVSPMPKSPRYR
jgi:hypothetical protein